MIRKEPPISRRHPTKETSQKTGQEAPPETSEHELQKGKAIITGQPREKFMEGSSGGFSPYEAPPVSLWLPFTAYFTSFILIFLKTIEYDVIGFIGLFLSPITPLEVEVLFSEFILGSLIQSMGVFVFVWLILLFLSLFRVGRRKNFRRWLHSGFAALLIIATLIVP